MPPFAADPPRSIHDAPLHDKAASATCPEDDAEDPPRTGTRTIDGFRKGKAVRVVGEPEAGAELRLEIGGESPAIEPCRIGVLDQPSPRRDGTGNSNSDICARNAGFAFEISDYIGESGERGVIIVARRWAPLFRENAASRVHGNGGDLGTAEVDADANLE
jgi:hypothetical protein